MDTDPTHRIERWRVPVRIDFAGGTLDLWPIYALMGGGCTVNAAIDLWIELEASFGGEATPRSRRISSPVLPLLASLGRGGGPVTTPRSHRTSSPALPLLASLGRGGGPVTTRIGSTDLGLSFEAADWPQVAPRDLSWVWRVLSATPRRPDFLNIKSPVPKGSGLGVSSCLGVGLLGMAMGIEAGEELAAQVPMLRDLEAQELQTPAGWQDFYPAALGGCLALHWGPQPRWEPLIPHRELLEDLLVFYTGQPHHSGVTNWEAYKRFIEGDATTREALKDIALVAEEMALAVPKDPVAVGELLEREGAARVRLSPFVETDAMRAVRERGKRDGWFLGMKPCGAGGGGCCILVVKKGGREAAQAALQSMALPVLEADITQRGLHRV